MSGKEFEPYILGFLCSWGSYAAADLAGSTQTQYPPNLRIIRIPCSGRVDPTFVLNALKSGVDGVLVAGCHLGECHFINGNYRTERRVALLKKMLTEFGFESRRVRLEWFSGSEGEKFAQVVKGFMKELKKIGPNPAKVGNIL